MAKTIEADVVVIGAGITSAMFVERLSETVVGVLILVNCRYTIDALRWKHFLVELF